MFCGAFFRAVKVDRNPRGDALNLRAECRQIVNERDGERRIALARAIGCEAIAFAVEMGEKRKTLRGEMCFEGDGFSFHRSQLEPLRM